METKMERERERERERKAELMVIFALKLTNSRSTGGVCPSHLRFLTSPIY